MRIYLAGKMDKEYGSWRDAILPKRYDQEIRKDVPGWVLLRDEDDPQWGNDDYRCSMPWPRSENRHVLGLHEYVGPYRTDLRGSWEWKHYGEFHGSKVAGQHGGSNGKEDGLIVGECLAALHRADLVFAYINRPDCFGTLVEVGMAKEAGAFVAVAVEPGGEWDESDYWFLHHVADVLIAAGNPVDVGPEPSSDFPLDATEEERWAHWDGRSAWHERKSQEKARIRGALKDAVLAWSARTAKPAPLELVRQDDSQRLLAALTEAANAFAQIGRWSADPRVRDEARRMLKRIAG